MLPLAPVMVRVEVLAAAELGALTVSVAEPGAFTELELNVAVTPVGAPLTLSATAPLNPFTTPTLTVELPLRSEEHTPELQSHLNLVCRLLLQKKKHPST